MKTPKRILERRKSVRIDDHFLFKIGHRGYEIQAITLNVSSSGAMCVIDRDVPVMSQLKIGLQLPGRKAASSGRTLHMKGVVVRKERDIRTGRYLVAVYFSDVKPSDQKSLNQFIFSYLQSKR